MVKYMSKARKRIEHEELALNDELALLADYKLTGNESIRQRILNSYIGYLYGISCSKYGSDEYVGEAFIVLSDCLEKYDVRSGVRLGTYAYKFILERLRCLANGVKSRNGKIDKIKRGKNTFVTTYGYEPSVEELADYLGMNRRSVAYYMNYYSHNVALAPDFDVPDEQPTEADSHDLVIPNGVLTADEKTYLEYHLKGYKRNEIYKIIGGNWYDVCKMYGRIVDKLRTYYRENEQIDEIPKHIRKEFENG